MKEFPILFSAPMVRAILAGDKTQTRRVVKPQFAPDAVPAEMCAETAEGWQTTGHSGLWWCDAAGNADDAIRCPYGIPGDRLWVRETFYAFGRWETRFSAKKGRDEWHFIDMTVECGKAYAYAADGAPHDFKKGNQRSSITPAWWKRPAIHMPRAASRITPEIIGVRVEHLQDISEADARAEGTAGGHGAIPGYQYNATPGEHYRWLWNSINGSVSWDANPWVWVVEFKRIAPTLPDADLQALVDQAQELRMGY